MSSNIKVQKNCEFCGQAFTARTLYTRYCSKLCNSRHYKQLSRSQKVEIHVNQSNIIGNQCEATASEYYTIKEAAQIMKVSKRTLYRLIALQKLRQKKILTRSVILKKDIETFFDYQ